MKRLILVLLFTGGLALGPDKPVVCVPRKGSGEMTTAGPGGGGRAWGAWSSSGTGSHVAQHDLPLQIR